MSFRFLQSHEEIFKAQYHQYINHRQSGGGGDSAGPFPRSADSQRVAKENCTAKVSRRRLAPAFKYNHYLFRAEANHEGDMTGVHTEEVGNGNRDQHRQDL